MSSRTMFVRGRRWVVAMGLIVSCMVVMGGNGTVMAGGEPPTGVAVGQPANPELAALKKALADVKALEAAAQSNPAAGTALRGILTEARLRIDAEMLRRGGRSLPAVQTRHLVTSSLLAFDAAVQAGDFTEFHKGLAAPFRNQFTAQKLQAIFQQFIDTKVRIGGIKDVQPVYTQSGFTAGEPTKLQLAGRYPTRPSAVTFKLILIPEAGDWRLISISVNVKPVT